MKIALIDNYDSFTHNLVHYLEMFDCQVEVFRNNELELEDLQSFDALVLSPGPGIPKQAGLLMDIIKEYHSSKKILGVCLGMQAIGEFFGATLLNSENPVHGMASELEVIDTAEILFKNLPSKTQVGRYHSWVIDEKDFPNDLTITSKTFKNEIMSIRHKYFNICGVQFHPESILTPFGKDMIKNWLFEK